MDVPETFCREWPVRILPLHGNKPLFRRELSRQFSQVDDTPGAMHPHQQGVGECAVIEAVNICFGHSGQGSGNFGDEVYIETGARTFT